jgi:hypothetical protein
VKEGEWREEIEERRDYVEGKVERGGTYCET